MKTVIIKSGSLTLRELLRFSTKEYGDYFKENPNRIKFVLKVVLSDWMASEPVAAKTRKAVKNLLPLTLGDKELSFFRPDNGSKLYRGGLISKNKPISFSYSKKVAKGFGKPMYLTVNPKLKAIDLDKVFGKGQSENEVIVIIK